MDTGHTVATIAAGLAAYAVAVRLGLLRNRSTGGRILVMAPIFLVVFFVLDLLWPAGG